MSGGRRGGERRQHTQPSVCTRVGTRNCSQRQKKGTRPSLGPSTRARQSSLHSAAQVSEVGHPKQHRGRANLRKQEEPAPGSRRMDEARLATSHRFRKGEGVRRRRKGRRSRPPSLRGSKSFGFGCSHVETQLQKSVSDVRSRISSANALQKERSGSSERGPSSRQTRAVETAGGCGERNDES